MVEDKMPDCEYGDHCTIPGCPLKHPPKMADVKLLAGSDIVEGMPILQTGILSVWKTL